MPRLIGLTLCVVFAILLILAISGPHSTLEAQNSLSVPKVLHNFKAANPPKIVRRLNLSLVRPKKGPLPIIEAVAWC